MSQAVPGGTPHNDMRLLEGAVAGDDRSAFEIAIEAIDWSKHSPKDLVDAIRLAFKVDAHGIAHTLAQIGARLFSDDEACQKYARALAPAKLLRTDLPPQPGAEADIRWLREHASEYRGRYVALKDGELLDAADSFAPLIAKFPRGSLVLVTRIP
jgi:hypothetical protein